MNRLLASLSLLALVLGCWSSALAGPIVGTLTPKSPTSIEEGNTVTFGSTFSAIVGGEHIGSGGSGYAISGGPFSVVSGPTGFPLPHGQTSYTPTDTTVRFEDEGSFSISLTGGYTTHISSHQTVFSGGFPGSLGVSVSNVAPIIEALTGDLTVSVNEPFGFSADATDPGPVDVLSFDWDLDDNGQYDDFTGQNGVHSFLTGGLHTVNLRVSDGDGGFDFGSFNVTAVPEPSSLLLFIVGTTVGLVGHLRRRKRKTES